MRHQNYASKSREMVLNYIHMSNAQNPDMTFH